MVILTSEENREHEGHQPSAAPASLPRPNVIPAAIRPKSTCRPPDFKSGEPVVRLTPAPMAKNEKHITTVIYNTLVTRTLKERNGIEKSVYESLAALAILDISECATRFWQWEEER
jgi:hypothetical protein